MIQTEHDRIEIQRRLRRSLDAVELSPPCSYQSLTVWFLLGGTVRADYSLLDHALSDGTAHVTEVDGGSVPDLKFVNRRDRPVLLTDGEELLGGMQNRSLNLSILAPPGESLTIPVSCMEAGRWHYDEAEAEAGAEQGRGMRGSEHVMNARLRMHRMRAVSAAMRREAGSRRSDQAAIWKEIDQLSESLDTRSDTGAINSAFQRYDAELSEYVAALRPRQTIRRRACGVVFAIMGGAHGLDLFDARSTFNSLYPKLIRSWSLDAIEARRKDGGNSVSRVDPRMLRDRLARRRSRVYPAVGMGTDARLDRTGSRLHGAALVNNEQVVHVSAFHSGFDA